VVNSIGSQSFPTCLFCAIVLEDRASLPWYDQPLMEAQGIALAVAGIGAFVPGYTLVATSTHVRSTQNLARARQPKFNEFLTIVIQRVEAHFGPVTVFEHGSCGDSRNRSSACIEHAHIQIIPGNYSFASLGLTVSTFRSFADFLSSTNINEGYLMYREPGGPICYATDVGMSQFFRRHIARHLGIDEEWDYALFPRWGFVRQTLDVIENETCASRKLGTQA
jgi:diadenosine tetraphosphate (Ap4A) HIT family hydrolase